MKKVNWIKKDKQSEEKTRENTKSLKKSFWKEFFKYGIIGIIFFIMGGPIIGAVGMVFIFVFFIPFIDLLMYPIVLISAYFPFPTPTFFNYFINLFILFGLVGYLLKKITKERFTIFWITFVTIILLFSLSFVNFMISVALTM